MSDTIGNIDFIFNLAKELDVFIDSIPSRVKLSARHKVLVREYALACFLHALCFGHGEFRLEATIRETVGILEFGGKNQMNLAAKALEAETHALVAGVKDTILFSPAVQHGLYDVFTFTEKSKVSLASLLLSGSIDSVLEAASRISLSALLHMAESDTEFPPAAHSVKLEWDSPDIAELELNLSPPEGAEIELQTVCGRLYVVVYRLFSECSQVTMHDLSSMTLGDFFYIEK